MRAPLSFLLQMLARQMLSERSPVDHRPTLVYLPVGLPAELQLFVVTLPGEDHRVDVHVFRIAMDGVDDLAFRKLLLLMVIHHLPRLLVARLRVERVDRAVVTPGLATATMRACPLVLVALARKLDEVLPVLLVCDGLVCAAINIVGDVLRPDAFFDALRGAPFRVVEGALAPAPRRADAEFQTDAHRLMAPVSSLSNEAACSAVRSSASCE